MSGCDAGVGAGSFGYGLWDTGYGVQVQVHNVWRVGSQIEERHESHLA